MFLTIIIGISSRHFLGAFPFKPAAHYVCLVRPAVGPGTKGELYR